MKWVAPIKPYKWHYKWITGAITPISGVIWAPITGFWAKNKGESILIIQLPPADSFRKRQGTTFFLPEKYVLELKLTARELDNLTFSIT